MDYCNLSLSNEESNRNKIRKLLFWRGTTSLQPQIVFGFRCLFSKRSSESDLLHLFKSRSLLSTVFGIDLPLKVNWPFLRDHRVDVSCMHRERGVGCADSG